MSKYAVVTQEMHNEVKSRGTGWESAFPVGAICEIIGAVIPNRLRLRHKICSFDFPLQMVTIHDSDFEPLPFD